jgi:hypothetical protein
MVLGPIVFMRIVRINPLVYRFAPTYTSGAYLTVNKNVGSLIDWVSEKIAEMFRELICHLIVQHPGKYFWTRAIS